MDPKLNDIVAIDIAKDELFVMIANHGFRVSNNAYGLRQLRKHLEGLAAPWIFCEATGGYERSLVNMLHQEGIKVTVINPARVRHFARSEGMKAKNDPIDTRMIMRFACEKQLAPTPPPKRPELAAMMDRRNHLSDELSREKNRLQNSSPLIHQSICRSIDFLKKEITFIDQSIEEQIKKDESAHKASTLMQQVKGIGPVTAWAIIAYLPEITQLSRNRITAMVGLAPFCHDSGTSTGPRHICGGRKKIRDKLYMAVVTASIHNPVIKTYVQQLKNRGFHTKSARTAAMRKMLIHLQAILKKENICLA